ncbi:hypothetical protein OAL04_04000, partial [Nitrospinae bacterium]|nr:hypothetical protein [Nitrospinota bacterium]
KYENPSAKIIMIVQVVILNFCNIEFSSGSPWQQWLLVFKTNSNGQYGQVILHYLLMHEKIKQTGARP